MKTTMFITIALLGAAVAAHADNAKVNWEMHCAMCHGKKGQGNTRMGKYLGVQSFQDPKVQASFTDEQAAKAIKDGVEKDGRRLMKPFSTELTEKDIQELVKHVRTFKKGK